MGLETGRDVLRLYTTNFEYSLEFCIDRKHDSELIGNLSQGRSRLSAINSDQQIRNWMDTCATHESCNAYHGGIYPTRLLDLGSGRGDPPRLVDTASEGIDGEKYAFFSYRWGDAQFLKATPDNIDQLYQGVPMHEFGLLHQEAMAICRRLGYRYIWIDALCILRGTDDDFMLEAPRMGGYIESADIVFISINTSVSEPIIQPKPPEVNLPISAYVEEESGTTRTPFTLFLRNPGQIRLRLRTVRSSVADGDLWK